LLSVLCGLAAAASYGAADFLGGLATRRSAVFGVVSGVQVTGLVLLLPVAPFFGGTFSSRALQYGVLAGICTAGGIALLYYALAIGRMGVVSPITAVVAAMVPVIAGALRGEHLTSLKIVGILAALLAVVLVSTSPAGAHASRRFTGIREALLSGILLGGVYVFLAAAGSGAGLYPLLTARAASVILIVAAVLVLRRPPVAPAAVLPLILVAGIIDMAANVLYVLSAYAGMVSIAAVLTSLYPASTVLLAALVLRERLASRQIAGVALALGSVVLIAK
jgi:drug/metabolite transporter (DMT)-like permease